MDFNTKTSSTYFLQRKSQKNFLKSLLLVCKNLYIYHPCSFILDPSLQFTVKLFYTVYKFHEIEERSSGMEKHNAFGAVKQYHLFLLMANTRVWIDLSELSQELVITIKTKTSIAISGPNKLSGWYELMLEKYQAASEKGEIQSITHFYTNCYKLYLFHDSATIRAFSIFLILSAAMHRLRLLFTRFCASTSTE